MTDKFSKVPRRPDAERRLRQNSRMARAFRLLQLIQSRGRWNAAELAAEIECSERTIYRDLQVLEMAGIPWMFDEKTKCYRVRPGWQFPVMHLTPEELVGQATATAIVGAAGLNVGSGSRPTTRKLASTLSTERQQLLEDAEQLVAVLDLKLADQGRNQEVIRTIQWALLERKQITGLYESPYQEKALKVTLNPYRLCLAQQAWYLVGRPTDGDSPKTYRVNRFRSVRTLGISSDVPENFDLKRYFGNAWGVFRGDKTYDVELLFHADAAAVVTETTWHATQNVKRHADDSATLRFQIDGLEEILYWVLGWAGRVKILKPDELRQQFVAHLRSAISDNS